MESPSSNPTVVNSRLHLVGLVVALVGSVGLAMYGAAVAGSLDVFVVDDESRHSAAMASLPATMLSIIALVVGLVVARVASLRLGSRSTTGGLLLAAAAGLLLVAGGCLCGWSISWALRGFMLMAESETTPKPEQVDLVIRTAEPSRVVGIVLVILSAVLSLAAGLLGFREKPATAVSKGDAFGGLVRWVSIGAGAMLVCLAVWAWHHGSAIQGLLAEDVLPKPYEFATHVKAILDESLLVFAGIGVLGLFGLVADLLAFSRGS